MNTRQLISILCYVEEPWAYFTTSTLDKEWGDDWNDAPYEHNAGTPYGSDAEIVVVAFRGSFETPREGHLNSPYSVEDINKGAVPWLQTSRYAHGDKDPIKIMAGTTLHDFIHAILNAGGEIYLPHNP